MPILNASQWDEFISKWPEAHLLQTSMWGDLKCQFGWRPIRVANDSDGAQILFRSLLLGYTIAYIPKGPVGKNWKEIWPEVHAVCRQQKAIFLRVEPDREDPLDENLTSLLAGFTPVADTIQPRQTILIDITGDPETWLARMKQKTRYNTRLAEKKDVRVVESQDFDAFDHLMKATGQRDGFGVHTLAYYKAAYASFEEKNQVALLQAEFNGKPLAMLMVFCQGKRAYYLYGASGDEERQRMPAYLLQFEAMKWAASRGCSEYDLWGIPDASEEELEEHFEERSESLWGVYRFKRGLGGRLSRSCPGYDYVYQPLLYKILRWQMGRNRRVAGG